MVDIALIKNYETKTFRRKLLEKNFKTKAYRIYDKNYLF